MLVSSCVHMFAVYWGVESVSPKILHNHIVFKVTPFYISIGKYRGSPSLYSCQPQISVICLSFLFSFDKSLHSPSWLWATGHIHLLVLCEASMVTTALPKHLPFWFCDMRLSSIEFMLKNHNTKFKTGKSRHARVLSKQWFLGWAYS